MDYWPALVVMAMVGLSFHYLHKELDRRFKDIERRLDVIFDRQRPEGDA
jgi:hypothetical protein